MQQLKIAAFIALAVILQTSFPQIWKPLTYLDLPLIVVVYAALNREVVQAMIIAAAAGLALDAVSAGGLLGAGGFSKTLTAFIISSLASRVNIDNPLARIPVLAGAVVFNEAIYVLLHRMLGQAPLKPFVEPTALKLIGTTVVGSIILLIIDTFFSERARSRRQLAGRRRIARRSIVRLRKR